MTDIEKLARDADPLADQLLALVKQAGMDCEEATTFRPSLIGAYGNRKQIKALVEAVARRCAEVCEDRMGRTAFELEAGRCAAAIRAEFGIKEEP